MLRTECFPKIEAPDAAGFCRWLEANHAQEGSVWLVTWPKRPGAPHLSREAVLDALPPSHRRDVLRWIASARTASTRAKRVATVADLARHGKRVPQF